MPSGYTMSESRGAFHGQDAMFDVARVVNVPSHEPGDNQQHLVQIQTDPNDTNSVVWAPVAVSAVGDINMPVEGDVVRVGYEVSGQPIVLSIRYRVENEQADTRLPKYGPGHRRIVGGPQDDDYTHDSRIELYPDGAIELQPAPGKPLILGGGEQSVFRDPETDFEYQPNGDFFQMEFDRVNDRVLSQQFMDEHDIETIEDTDQLPMWDDETYEWVIPDSDSEWRDPDPKGGVWTVETTIRFEKVESQTACEVGLFIRGEDDAMSDGQLVNTQIEHVSHQQDIAALTVDFSYTDRFPQESRLSLHVRSSPSGGIISSDPLTYDGTEESITSDLYNEVELWDEYETSARETMASIRRGN